MPRRLHQREYKEVKGSAVNLDEREEEDKCRPKYVNDDGNEEIIVNADVQEADDPPNEDKDELPDREWPEDLVLDVYELGDDKLHHTLVAELAHELPNSFEFCLRKRRLGLGPKEFSNLLHFFFPFHSELPQRKVRAEDRRLPESGNAR